MMAGRYRWAGCGVATVLALTIGFVALKWLPLDADREDISEVVLVVRDMEFFQDGAFGAPNPPLRLKAGARVRLVLRNEDPGMTHNFAVPAWGVATRNLESGQTASVEFAVPSWNGPHAYECTPHARLMRGAIEVE